MALLLDYEFAPPPDSKEIDTKVFLESVFQLPSFLDRLGFKVFKLIRDDIKESITTIKAVYDSDPVKYETLQQILIAEKSMYGSEWPKAGATLALMWLKRCLRFIQILLQSLADGERDKDNPNLIRINISKAYDEALKRYHGWMIQNVFKAAVCAAPYRSDFLKALSKNQEVAEEDCLSKVRQFLINFTPAVDAIYEMYSIMNAELDYKV
ncbi:glycolipid transfer protein-like isoform X2 [Misgurnus anguillicaudatus]|uniref:glycolipid transfer protein-like isoform X2 n=1 Tax=Misgurnus anguillicaudatus TaxID=75329 RepID=UPI002434CF65|nr:glycolipid transfer protein-like isoform X1 [Misgurnus anguillicaudatus]